MSIYADQDTDLLALLSPADVDERVHVVMPCMGYACGGSLLDGGNFVIGPLPYWDRVTCPDCRAIGVDDLVAECRRQQSDQAGVA